MEKNDSNNRETKRFVKTKAAAEIVGLAEGTLHNMRLDKRGPSYIKVGKSILYDIDDLYLFMNSHKVKQ